MVGVVVYPIQAVKTFGELPNLYEVSHYRGGTLYLIYFSTNYLFDSKRVKYAENAAFDFPPLLEHQTKTIAKNQTNLLINKPYYTNCQNI